MMMMFLGNSDISSNLKADYVISAIFQKKKNILETLNILQNEIMKFVNC